MSCFSALVVNPNPMSKPNQWVSVNHKLALLSLSILHMQTLLVFKAELTFLSSLYCYNSGCSHLTWVRFFFLFFVLKCNLVSLRFHVALNIHFWAVSSTLGPFWCKQNKKNSGLNIKNIQCLSPDDLLYQPVFLQGAASQMKFDLRGWRPYTEMS